MDAQQALEICMWASDEVDKEYEAFKPHKKAHSLGKMSEQEYQLKYDVYAQRIQTLFKLRRTLRELFK